ncbi:Alpha-ketoglutarate-dependent dioxygenase alkB 6 [Podila humilis]|nr:Alpha-ketoglutarate-dependent dioxygenase alkB 6 [Podila humilis]
MTRPIDNVKLAGAPDYIYYLPDFISAEEEQSLIDKVLTAPKPKWVHLKNRRRLIIDHWGPIFYYINDIQLCTMDHVGGVVMHNGMIAESLPPWLTTLYPKFRECGVFDGLHPTLSEPNHCLPHQDGPAYLPTVATVSLGSHCILEFYRCPTEASEQDSEETPKDSRSLIPEFSILVQPRSLLVLKEDVYKKYMHGIREITTDDLAEGHILNLAQAYPDMNPNEARVQSLERTTRISLTFRIVEKTKSGKKFLRGF